MHVSSYDLSPGSGVPFHLFLSPESDKEQRIYEKQHIGILLLNIPWQFYKASIALISKPGEDITRKGLYFSFNRYKFK